MLQSQSEFVRECLERAARAREQAQATLDPGAKSEFFAQENRWLSLARSESLSERLSRFLSSKGTSRPRRDLVIPLFRDVAFDAESLQSLCKVFDRICGHLGILNDDPLYEFVARIIVEQAQTGVKDAATLEAATLVALGLGNVAKKPEHLETHAIVRLLQNKSGFPLRKMEYGKEPVLFQEGEKVARVYFPVTAVISLQALAEGYLDIAMLSNNAAVGALAAIDESVSLYRAVVRVSGSGFACHASEFREAALQDRSLLAAVLQCEREISVQTAQLLICNSTHLLEQRVASWLLRLHDISHLRQFSFTQEQIAEWLGARRTTITIAANHLRALGAIEYSRGVISIVDLKKLRASACDCFH